MDEQNKEKELEPLAEIHPFDPYNMDIEPSPLTEEELESAFLKEMDEINETLLACS